MSAFHFATPRFSTLRTGAVDRLLAGAGRAFGISVVAAGIALVCQIVLARALGPHEFGIFSLATAGLNLLTLLATLGSDAALVRLLPKYAATGDWPRFSGALRWSRHLTMILSASIALLAIAAIPGPGLEPDRTTVMTYCAAALSLPLCGLIAVNQSALQGLKCVARSQIPRLILRPCLLAAGVLPISLLAAGPLTAPVAMVVNFAALGLALAAGRRWLHDALPPAVRATKPQQEARNWTQLSLPLFLISGAGVFLQESGVILIGWLCDPADAGVYSVSMRIVRLMAFGMAAGNAIARPLFSELHTRDDRAELQRVSSLAALISVGASIACGSVLLAGRWFALGLFGEAFESGAAVIAILAVGQLINAVMGPGSELLSMTGHERTSARILIIVALLSVAAGYPAIRWYGMTGAAAVATGIIGVQNVWTWMEVRRRIGIDSTPLGLLSSLRSSRINLSSTGP